MSGIRSITRRPTVAGYASAGSAPIYVDSDDNILKIIPAGTGTTEVQQIDASSVQTLTNKTLTSPTINGATGTGAAEVVVTTKGVTAAESGKTFYLDLAAGFVTTLPAVALGLNYKFIIRTSVTGNMTIVCPAAAALFKGHVLTTDVNSATDPDFDTTAVATLTFVANKAVVGDRVRVESDGVNWFYSAECSVFDAITGS